MHSVPMVVALAFYALATLLYLLYLSGVRPSALSAAGPVLAVAALAHLGAIGWHHLGGLHPPITSAAGLLNLSVFVVVTAFLVVSLFRRTTLAGAFLAAIRAEGGRGTFVTKTGTSDMNVIGPRWGCPIVAYGPGDSAYDHTPDERIHLPEYLQSIRVLTGVLGRLDAILGSR